MTFVVEVGKVVVVGKRWGAGTNNRMAERGRKQGGGKGVLLIRALDHD